MARYIIVVLDDDLISYLDFAEDGMATLLGTWIEWLASAFRDLIQQRLKQLPDKSKKFTPFLYWVAAPTHTYFDKVINQQRIKFNLSFESVIRARENENMQVMKLKDIWNSKDSTLIINNRMSEHGLTVY